MEAPPFATDEAPDESLTAPKDTADAPPSADEAISDMRVTPPEADHYLIGRDLADDEILLKSDGSSAASQFVIAAAEKIDAAEQPEASQQPYTDRSPIAESVPVIWTSSSTYDPDLDTSAQDWTGSPTNTSSMAFTSAPVPDALVFVLPVGAASRPAMDLDHNGRAELAASGLPVPATLPVTSQPAATRATPQIDVAPPMHGIRAYSGVEDALSRAVVMNTMHASRPAEPVQGMIERGIPGNNWIDSGKLPPPPELPQPVVAATRGIDPTLGVRNLDTLPGSIAVRGTPVSVESTQSVNIDAPEAVDAQTSEIGSRNLPIMDSAAVPAASNMRSGIAVQPALHTSVQADSGAQGNPSKNIFPFLEAGGSGHAELRSYAAQAEPGRHSEAASDRKTPISATSAPATYFSIGGKSWTEERIAEIQDEDPTGIKGELAPLDGVTEHRILASAERLSQHPSPNAHPTRQLAETIVRASPKQAETELVLTPEELGKVRFAFSQQDGVLTIAISADRPDTLALLRRNADMLSADLAQSGLGDATLDFGTSGRDRGRQDERPTWAETTQSAPIELTEQRPRIQPMQRPTGSGRIDLRL